VLAVNVVNRWSWKRIAGLALLFTAMAAVTVSVAYFALLGSEDSTGKFLFVESRTIVEIEVLQGKWVRMIDFPSYWYNVSTGRITYSGRPFDLDKLLAVYGSLLAYRGAGRGVSSCLNPIYSTPFLDPCDSSLSISSINKDGTAHVIYQNQEIVVSLNQQWQTENETIENSDGAVVRFKRAVTIENLGFWKKTNISRNGGPLAVSPANLVIVEDRSRSSVMKRYVVVSKHVAIETLKPSCRNQFLIESCSLT